MATATKTRKDLDAWLAEVDALTADAKIETKSLRRTARFHQKALKETRK